MTTKILQLVVGLLVQATVTLAQWPCPEPADIAPCICTVEDPYTQLYLDCSDVGSDAQLEDAFNAVFPFHNFNRLTIVSKTSEPRVPITRIDSQLLKNLNFSNIRISHTNLEYIGPFVFHNFLDRLESIIITDNFIETFPFDILASTTQLKDLRVFRNRISHMSDLNSESLEYLQISYNRGMQFGDQAFWGVPNLKQLILNDLDLDYVASHAFIKQTQLEYLDLSFNLLKTLYNESLHFDPSATLQQLKLEGNQISIVENYAFHGLKPGVFLWMQHNLLTDLPEDVWRPVFESVRASPSTALFVFDDNEIICECDLSWLILTEDYMDILAVGTICAGSGDEIHDIDKDFILSQCGTPAPYYL